MVNYRTSSFLFFFIIFSLAAISQRKSVIEERKIGTFTLLIYLPPDYDTTRKYKTLYFNDGQTIFSSEGLDVRNTADKLIQTKLIDPIVIVGIFSDHNRTSNYVPYEDESAKEDFGNYKPSAANYSKKIIEQIIPFVERNYSVTAQRGIAGYSFGGLHATWTALNYPGEFVFAGGLSPSYWVKEFEIFKEGKKAESQQIYYFDVGTGEWNYYVPMLLHSGLPILKNIFYYEEEGSHHQLSDWRGQRITNMLLLFAGHTDFSDYNWKLSTEIIKSEYTGKFYLRINPLITYANGLVCSVSYAASYILENADDGIVNKDGSFRFINQKDLHVRVSYNGETKRTTISYQEVEKIKQAK